MIIACWLVLGVLTFPSCQSYVAPPVARALETKKANKKSVVDEVSSYKRDQPLKYPLVLTHDVASKGVGIPPVLSHQDGAKNVHGPGDSKHQRNLLLRFGRSVDLLTLCSGCSDKESTALSGDVRHVNELSKAVESRPIFIMVSPVTTGTRSVSRRKRGSSQYIQYPEGLARGRASWTRAVPGTPKSIRKTDAGNVETAGDIGLGASKTAVETNTGNFRTIRNAGTDEYAPDSTVIAHVEGFRTSFPHPVHASSFSRLGQRLSGVFPFLKRDRKMAAVHSHSEKVYHSNFIRFG
ncbi:uncharacterized protein [Macrobrachium rosenbergii]|uniref:uncharacterized protein n=1 Tax=Macrobrachium rosenbergii TaxID=79674 RepID=UPI0034D49394